MSKSLRAKLRSDDRTLVEVDVKNSQPFLIPHVIRDYIWREGKKGKREETKKKDRREQEVKSKHSVLEDELKNFHNLVVDGNFYELFESESDRNSIKEMVFTYIFSKDNLKTVSCIQKTLQKQFPKICNVIAQMKRENHRVFAHCLQKLESDIVIEGACRALMAREPEMPIVTVHDSILTTEPFVEIVSEELQRAFEDRCGVVPAMTKTDYHTANEMTLVQKKRGKSQTVMVPPSGVA